MLKIAMTAAAFLFAMPVVAQTSLNPPIPSTAKASDKEQQKPAAYNQTTHDHELGTESVPVIVKMLNPPNTDAIAAEIKKNREYQTTDDGNFVLFSSLLVVVGILQGVALAYTALVTNKAANAAKTAAEAIPLIERPYIFVHGAEWRMGQKRPPITYTVSNNGKMAAIIKDVRIGCGIELRGQFPNPVIIGDHPLLQEPILSANQRVARLEHSPVNEFYVFDTPANVLRNKLIFQVIVSYNGPFSKGHETAQCWQYDKSLHGFFEISDPKYTYIR